MTDDTRRLREEDDILGLSVDMLDADRLRTWAVSIETYGADITHWSDPKFIVTKLREMATGIETVVRDVGRLREAAAVTPEGRQDWQPIETAPKDGSSLLIWADGRHLIHLFWKIDHWEWLGGGRCADGQYRKTHWMPLPAPPIADGRQTPETPK